MIPTNKLIFILLCVPARLLLTSLVEKVQYKKFVIPLLIAIAIGFLFNSSTAKGAFGSVRYWPSEIHALLFSIAAVMLLFDSTEHEAYKVMLFDLFLGMLVVFSHYHKY